MVRNKSKTNDAPRLVVLFYVQSNLFCTDAEFAPCRRWERCRARAGWLDGARWRGWQGYTPPFTPIVGTIKGFSLQKFFFDFRVPLAVSVG